MPPVLSCDGISDASTCFATLIANSNPVDFSTSKCLINIQDWFEDTSHKPKGYQAQNDSKRKW